MKNRKKSHKGKKIIFKLLFMLILFLQITFSQNNQFRLGYTGAYPNYFDVITYGINWNYYTEMNMNLWQGWWVGDTAVTVISNLNTYNIDGYFQPDTLRWAGYGRIQTNYAASGRDDRFIFNNVSQCAQTKNDSLNGGKPVLYFDKTYNCNQQNPAQMVLWGVKQNAFQSLTGLPYDPMYQVPFPGNGNNGNAYHNTYYVKPRMRISVDDAMGPRTEVVRIIVKKFNGYIDLNDTITIYTDYFLINGQYDGSYKEDFYSLPQIQSHLSIPADTINAIGEPNGRPLNSFDPNVLLSQCQVDYEIYWYGTVSFYIDYVKVMDESAQELFDNQTLVGIRLKERLHEKVQRLQQNDPQNKMKGFYMEEVDFSNLSCLKLLNDTLLPAWSGNNPNYKMISLLGTQSYLSYLRNNDWSYYWNYFDSLHVPIFMIDQYPYTGVIHSNPDWLWKMPTNVSSTLTFPSYFSQSINEDIQNIYNEGTIFVSSGEYNSQLQSQLTQMEGYLKSVFNPLCQQHNVTMYCVPQVIFWHYHDSNFWMREPMTSEIEAEFGIDLCNGAKGILPYAYESWRTDSLSTQIHGGSQEQYESGDSINYYYNMSMGASDFDANTSWGWRKREQDVYGEYKWDSLKALYAKMKVWGPIIANSTSTTGYSVATDGANHQYISNIWSIDPRIHQQNPCMDIYENLWMDCPDSAFWEMGIFTSSDGNKYFLMVNRRCVPEKYDHSDLGDIRELRIAFNKTLLPTYNTWALEDVFTNQTVQFDKNYNQPINMGETDGTMGYFHPGEGKLFKLYPVVNNGGTLAADESFSGVNIICHGVVNSNGYNITFSGSNNTVSFDTGATINMNGGIFTVSSSTETSQQNVFKGSGSTWQGLNFQKCTVYIYNTTFQDISSNQMNYALNLENCVYGDIRYNNFVSTGDSTGGISSFYLTDNNLSGLIISYNNFTMNNSFANAIQVQGFAGLTLPVYIQNNTISIRK